MASPRKLACFFCHWCPREQPSGAESLADVMSGVFWGSSRASPLLPDRETWPRLCTLLPIQAPPLCCLPRPPAAKEPSPFSSGDDKLTACSRLQHLLNLCDRSSPGHVVWIRAPAMTILSSPFNLWLGRFSTRSSVLSKKEQVKNVPSFSYGHP